MSRDKWTDEEAAVQAECWDHGFVLPYEALVEEVERRRDYLQAAWGRDCRPNCPCGCQEPPA